MVPRKGADFKFNAVGSWGFVTVPRFAGSYSQINLLRQSWPCVNSAELRRIAGRKDLQKGLQGHTKKQ